MRGNLTSPGPVQCGVGSIPAYAGEPSRRCGCANRSWVYPRVCGGTVKDNLAGAPVIGLSPRMRGNRARCRRNRWRRWSIPAYAGEPKTLVIGSINVGVYPRVCGGTWPAISKVLDQKGLSPRMRGNRCVSNPHPGCGGSIPAYAGEPECDGREYQPCRVYPRVCGGTSIQQGVTVLAEGLSPRMRGNPRVRNKRGASRGSIPAYAGEPKSQPVNSPNNWVYPRVCGGTHPKKTPPGTPTGLSPRMRGNPQIETIQVLPDAVYPRVCGGTSSLYASAGLTRGLSPRMRGNRAHRDRQALCAGSIPAYAGEPKRPSPRRSRAPVYPRVCGGTFALPIPASWPKGLSPRMRGNLQPG